MRQRVIERVANRGLQVGLKIVYHDGYFSITCLDGNPSGGCGATEGEALAWATGYEVGKKSIPNTEGGVSDEH